MGIETYNKHCRGIVTRYSKEWERTIKRLGRWIDFENDYKTMVNQACVVCALSPSLSLFLSHYGFNSTVWSKSLDATFVPAEVESMPLGCHVSEIEVESMPVERPRAFVIPCVTKRLRRQVLGVDLMTLFTPSAVVLSLDIPSVSFPRPQSVID